MMMVHARWYARTPEVGVEEGLDEGAGVVGGAEQGRGQEGAQAGAEEGSHLHLRGGDGREKGWGWGCAGGGRML